VEVAISKVKINKKIKKGGLFYGIKIEIENYRYFLKDWIY